MAPPGLRVRASNHKIGYVKQVWKILNLKGNQNLINGSKVTAILLEGLILPVGGVVSGRVCACSLRRRLVYPNSLASVNRVDLRLLPGSFPCKR